MTTFTFIGDEPNGGSVTHEFVLRYVREIRLWKQNGLPVLVLSIESQPPFTVGCFNAVNAESFKAQARALVSVWLEAA